MGHESRKRKHLPPQVWVEIRTGYEYGDNVREMAKKYKISHTTIIQRAKRHGWAKWGSEAEKAFKAAKEKRAEEIADEYEKAVREINEKQLKLYRATADYATFLLDQSIKKTKAIVALSEHEAKAAAITSDLPIIPRDTGKEIYRLDKIVDIYDKAMLRAERYLLGIEEAPILKKDKTSGVNEIRDVLEQARKDYGEELKSERDSEGRKAAA